MKPFFRAVVLLLLALPGAASAQLVIRFEGGLWYDGQDFVERTVYVVDGVFQDTFDGPPNVRSNMGGSYVVPPFADAHNHGLGDGGFRGEVAHLLRQGIFYLANPNNIPRLTAEVKPHVNTLGSVDVIYSNGGLTGPGGHPIQIYDRFADQMSDWSRDDMNGQAYHVVAGPADLESVWARIDAQEPDFLKVYLKVSEQHVRRADDAKFYGKRGLDPRLLPKIVDKAHAASLRVVAHVTTAADVRAALDAGVDAIAHLPLEKLDGATATVAAKRGTVFMTTVSSHRPTADFSDVEAVHRHNLQLLHEHGVALVLGTDSERSVLDEAEEVARLGGFEPLEILEMLATATPRWIFPERRIGSLDAGNEASFLVLDGDPRQDLGALRQISGRFQRGKPLEIAPSGPKKPSIAQRIAHDLIAQGVDHAIVEYRRLRSAEADAWSFAEQELNDLGYRLLMHNRVDDAVRIFELNAEQFPEAPNVHDSLGEGLMKAGRVRDAIRSYERALELNPRSQHARKQLETLRAQLAADDS